MMPGAGNAARALPLPELGLGFWVLFLVCAQAALQFPYLVLVPGERTNLLTPALTLLPLALFWRGAGGAAAWRFWAPWLALGAGLAVVGVLSPAPGPSLLRAFAFWAPALAGLICGRAFCANSQRLGALFGILTACFAAVAAANLLLGRPPEFLGLHHHTLTGTLVLLSAGPIWLAWTASGWRRWASVALLAAGYLLCFMAGSRFLVLLPAVLLPLLLTLRRMRLRHALAWTALALIAGWLFFALNPGKSLRYTNYESTFYRLEGIPASLEILREHPLAGIGMRTPRVELLRDYEPTFGMVGKDAFLAVVSRNVTADNQYLSLPVGIGIPLALLYFGLLGRELRRLAGRGRRGELPQAAQWALFMPLMITLIHFVIYDGLFFPQVSWLLHLLTGAGVAAGFPGGASSPEEAAGNVHGGGRGA